jgi:hypothetical protein
MALANTLAYYDTATSTAVKSLIILTFDMNITKPFFPFTLMLNQIVTPIVLDLYVQTILHYCAQPNPTFKEETNIKILGKDK